MCRGGAVGVIVDVFGLAVVYNPMYVWCCDAENCLMEVEVFGFCVLKRVSK